MVTRKPVPDSARPDAAARSPPPSPGRLQDMRRELWTSDSDRDTDDDERDSTRSTSRPRPRQTQTHTQAPHQLNLQDPARDHSNSPTPAGIPHTLRPGATPISSSTSAYSLLEEPQENVWRDESPRPLVSDSTRAPSATGPANPPAVAQTSSVPDALRPGPGGPGVVKSETNPFKRKPAPSPQRAAVQDGPPIPAVVLEAPTAPFSELRITSTEPSNNPWQPALEEQKQVLRKPSEPVMVSAADAQELGKDVWNTTSRDPSRSATPAVDKNSGAASPSLISFPTEEEVSSSVWDEIVPPPKPPKPVASIGAAGDEVDEGSHAWDDEGQRKTQVPAAATPSQVNDWNLIDNDPAPGNLSRQSTWENFEDAPDGQEVKSAPGQTLIDTSPDNPERSQPAAVAAPASAPAPAPPPPTSNEASRSTPQPVPMKNETYQIKNVNWHDPSAAKNPRTSPTLVQNANGPCPLVALVNALTLTTPADTQTALVDTLRSREQISLTFLLDAVFDELMSPRRMSEDTALPDVTELYEFLKGLHTGMNVNPRFIPTDDIVKAFKRTSLTHIHPTQRSDSMIPGTFENTREMRLYSIFAIPLIHGWLPSHAEEAYHAFKRHAGSYEDAQNLLFREEELDERLTSHGADSGLSEEEQALYQDILTIKAFLSSSATQLTRYGLEVIASAMKPGSVAILFRNDHFSTLYRHPEILSLLTLVTDAGYASHDEIVWESLVDINGESAEFFSGDFRVVGGAGQHQQSTANNRSQQQQQSQQPQQPRSSESTGSLWQTIKDCRGNRGSPSGEGASTSSPSMPAMSPNSEQEDRDLALAMQLQEEEDERHREQQQRRDRESMLSEQFIEQQARQQGDTGPNTRRSSNSGGSASVPVTTTPARGRGQSQSQSQSQSQPVRPLIPPVRPPVHRSTDEQAGDEAPPSYEQASKQEAYIPPEGHPSHAGSNGSGSGTSSRPRGAESAATGVRQTGRRAAGPARPPGGFTPGQPVPARGGYRQGVPPVSGSAGRERDCVVM